MPKDSWLSAGNVVLITMIPGVGKANLISSEASHFEGYLSLFATAWRGKWPLKKWHAVSVAANQCCAYVALRSVWLNIDRFHSLLWFKTCTSAIDFVQ